MATLMPDRPEWASGYWKHSGHTSIRKAPSRCASELYWCSVWRLCSLEAQHDAELHRNEGMYHNLYWDDSGYYENRTI